MEIRLTCVVHDHRNDQECEMQANTDMDRGVVLTFQAGALPRRFELGKCALHVLRTSTATTEHINCELIMMGNVGGC